MNPRTSNSTAILERPHVDVKNTKLARRCQEFLQTILSEFPWGIHVSDWTGNHYALGGESAHWYGAPLEIHIGSQGAARDVLALNGLRFLERFLQGEVDLRGNLFLLSHLKHYAKVNLSPWQIIVQFLKNLAFQTIPRASVNVKSHYDISQEALNTYLDQVYQSYSCGMWENPEHLDRQALIQIGKGQEDHFDSLEKAQWRKFKDAVDFLNPKEGQTLLDVGCGYGGQLLVALENYPFGKVVGWTHSHNQILQGSKLLAHFNRDHWEIKEGDYREDTRVYDHIASTGMACHVGPRGLVPYVRNIRKRMKSGGRYLHHVMMTPYRRRPLDFNVGVAFQKRYVWPGFHWFTLGEHVRALEKNGFQVVKLLNLSPHYQKTTAAWYERMMANEEAMHKAMGEPAFRAWRICYAGISGAFQVKEAHLYRVYCEAV